METFSALLAICVGNSPVPAQKPVTQSFDVFFDLHPNKRLSKQWWGWWFEMLSCPLWRHRNEVAVSVKQMTGKLSSWTIRWKGYTALYMVSSSSIMMSSHERNGVSNHRECLHLVQVNNKGSINGPRYWPFVRGTTVDRWIFHMQGHWCGKSWTFALCSKLHLQSQSRDRYTDTFIDSVIAEKTKCLEVSVTIVCTFVLLSGL